MLEPRPGGSAEAGPAAINGFDRRARDPSAQPRPEDGAAETRVLMMVSTRPPAAQPRTGRRRPGFDDGKSASPSSSVEAGPAATNGLDDVERARPGRSAEAGMAAMGFLHDGERAPPCLSRGRGGGDGVAR